MITWSLIGTAQMPGGAETLRPAQAPACEEHRSCGDWMTGLVDLVRCCVPDCGQQKSQPGGGGQHGVDRVALRMGEMVAAHAVLGFEMTDDRLDR